MGEKNVSYFKRKYIKSSIDYHIQRKFEFIKIKKLREFYKIYFLLLMIFGTITLFFIGYTTSKIFKAHIPIILYYYLLWSFLSLTLFPLLHRTKAFIRPVDQDLLFRTPLSNIQIFNLIFVTDIIKNFPSYIYLIALGVGITLNTNAPFINSIKVCLSFILYFGVAYIFQVIYTLTKINPSKKLFSYHYLILNIMIGSIVTCIGYYLTHCLVSFFVKPLLSVFSNTLAHKKHFSWLTYLTQIKGEVKSLNDGTIYFLNFFSPHFLLYKLKLLPLLILIILILLLIGLIMRRKVGYWYRDMPIPSQHQMPNFIYKIFSTQSLASIQWKNLFYNTEECALHKPFFYISYTIWLILGASIYLTHYSHHNIANAFIFIIILNNVSRDAFTTGVDFFTQSLRFDSEQRSIALYRITNTDFKLLYNAKLSVIRWLGYKELILTLLILISLFTTDIYIIIEGLIICLTNIIFIPNLALLPSYMSPHFSYQHYSELEDFEEQNMIDDSIFSKVKNGIPISYLAIFFVGYFSHQQYQNIMLFTISWSIFVFIALFFFVYTFKRIISKKWLSRDLNY